MAKTHFLLLVIFLILSSILCSVFSAKLNFTTDDQSSLLAIRDHITSDPHHILAKNWSTATSFCNWIGVKCGARHLRVTALNLSSMGLESTLPPHIGNLSFLSSLDLSVNNFHGHLPQEFTHSRRLKIINFTENSFSGAIPSWIGNFSKLESLVLASNNFASSIPEEIGNCRNIKNIKLRLNQLFGTIPSTIFNLSSLQYLSLSNNSLSGSLLNDMCQNLPNIEYISVSYNNLHGQLPSSIGECTNLQQIYLGKNKFIEGIPTSIGSLTKLKIISIKENRLNGLISPIFNISSLELISLGQNPFSGVLPKDICHKLPMLRSLSIRENGFTGSISKDICNCTFVVLNLSENYLTGEVPREIGNLHDLKLLNLGFNNLYGKIPHAIFNFSKLQNLDLYGNHLSGSLPSDFGFWLPNLQVLLLWENKLSGKIPSSISNASNLITIELTHNSFSGVIPNTLGNLRQLKRLILYDNKLTVKSTSSTDEWGFLSSLANCNQLKTLSLESNPLNGIIPAAPFGNLSASLQGFSASDCQLKGNIPIEFGNFSNMMTLSLYGNELTGSIPTTIGKLQRLQALYLHDNKLQRLIPHTLCNLQSLSILSLYQNGLSGPIPSCISNLTSLRTLQLASNKFSSTLPLSLWELTDILELNVSSNALNGHIPVEIQNLRALTSLDLSSNQFSGNIPTMLGGLQTLQNLSLGNNKLHGLIPGSFGSLVSLVSLDLSNNNLSGVIPESLVKLTSLKSFDVSYNKLEGRIPTEGPFKNFSAQSYKGNYGLCGSTYLNVSPCKSHHERKSTAVLVMKFVLPAIAATILIVLLIIVVMRRGHLKKKTDSSNTGESLLTKVTWRIVSYHELFNATNGFNDDMLLGVGSFGTVYKGSLSDGMIVAVKVFKLQPEDMALTSFEVKCEVMRNVRHRNLVQIITACYGMEFQALVLQFMSNGSLDKWLHSDNHYLDMKQRIDIMIDVASALDYLHNWSTQPVAHCDLKPNNVLLDEDMIAHVADFGIAKLLSESDHVTQTITLATFGYMAPEYGLQGNVSTKVDVYSYDILLLEVFTRKRPTDSMFDGEMSLKSWVCRSLPDNIYKVVDTDLLGVNEEQFIGAKRDCVLSTLELALNCCAELPEHRKDMGEVVNSLKKIKVYERCRSYRTIKGHSEKMLKMLYEIVLFFRCNL